MIHVSANHVARFERTWFGVNLWKSNACATLLVGFAP
jgi:hypothetical protein